MTDFTKLKTCLACGGSNLLRYADFGSQPLANDFHVGKDSGDIFPLGLQVCQDCWHSQQFGVVDPDRLYRDYAYASGTSNTLREYFAGFVAQVERDNPGVVIDDGPDPVPHVSILEIASNDGSLLKQFADRGHFVQGVDPSQLAKVADKAGIPTIRDYWNEKSSLLALGNQPGGYDVIVAMNVLGHVDQPLEFLELCKAVLAPHGRIYVQTSQAHMVRNTEFDTVYHEHISFFTGRSFMALADRAGLVVDKIGYAPVHGTSYLVELIAGDSQVTEDAFPIVIDEKHHGLYTPTIYKSFTYHVNELIDHVQSSLELARREGFRLAGYGAAAKGMAFINQAGLHMDFVVDDSPLKAGKSCPGSNIPVIAAADGRIDEQVPFMWLILAWNMEAEIKAKIKARRPANAADRFMVCFPKLTVTAQ